MELGFGMWCDGVSMLQNYDITIMQLVTCSVEPGTLVLTIWERHQHGDIRPCGDARRTVTGGELDRTVGCFAGTKINLHNDK